MDVKISEEYIINICNDQGIHRSPELDEKVLTEFGKIVCDAMKLSNGRRLTKSGIKRILTLQDIHLST